MDLIFDLDETIISTSLRQYKIISELINSDCPNFEKYEFERKHKALTNFQWLNKYEKVDEKSYLDHYLTKIETLEYLNLDLIKLKIKYLQILNQQNRKLFLVSMRSNKKESLRQLNNLGLTQYFNQIHFINHTNDKKNPKFEIVEKLKKQFCISYLLGDSSIDEIAAKSNRIIFLPVKSSLHDTFSKEGKEINYWLRKIILNGKIL